MPAFAPVLRPEVLPCATALIAAAEGRVVESELAVVLMLPAALD